MNRFRLHLTYENLLHRITFLHSTSPVCKPLVDSSSLTIMPIAQLVYFHRSFPTSSRHALSTLDWSPSSFKSTKQGLLV